MEASRAESVSTPRFVLEARDLSYAYRSGGKRGRMVFKHASFSVHAGEILTILGPNGAFKAGPAEEILQEERLSNLYQTEVRIIYSEELGRNVCVAGRHMHGGGEGQVFQTLIRT